MTREKTVYSPDELPHIWAHQTVVYGRSKQHNEHFDGVEYFSYGTAIGRILTRKKQTAYLLNVTSYSHTTAGHQSGLRQAVSGNGSVFKIGDIRMGASLRDVTGSMLFDYSIKCAADCANKIKHARTQKDYWLAEQATWLQQARDVCKFYGLTRKVDDQAVKRLSDRIAKENRRQAIAEKARQAQYEKENAKQLKQWLAGKAVSFPYSVTKVYLRYLFCDHPCNGTDTEVMQTSLGVRVPLADAKRAFRFALKHKDGWRRNGDHCKVGEYELDAINDTGICAGCHRITWEEINRFAKLMKWIK